MFFKNLDLLSTTFNKSMNDCSIKQPSLGMQPSLEGREVYLAWKEEMLRAEESEHPLLNAFSYGEISGTRALSSSPVLTVR